MMKLLILNIHNVIFECGRLIVDLLIGGENAAIYIYILMLSTYQNQILFALYA
jgi:hypothetical protein